LDASAAHVANLLSTEPADSRFLIWFFFVSSYFDAKVIIKHCLMIVH
jgi:hypothetical protein